MKNLYKKTLSLVLVTAMLLPVATISVSAIENTEPTNIPPWVEAGEIWHPADGMMPLEDFGYCPENHRPPSGYTYEGYTEGNTIFDGIIESGMVQLVGWLPGIGWIAQIISAASTIEWILAAMDEGHLRITYFKYVHTKGSLYWHHYSWFYRDENGLLRYVGCKVETNA